MYHIYDPSFQNFQQEAYDAKEGYAIRTSPDTGETEMYIAGSRTAGDWAANTWEGIWNMLDLPAFQPYRDKYVKHMEEIAKTNHVTVIYGHSRAGAIVNQMRVPGAEMVELDGADGLDSWLDRHTGHATLNIIQDQAFDKTIAAGGKDVVVLYGESPHYWVKGDDGKWHVNNEYHRVSRGWRKRPLLNGPRNKAPRKKKKINRYF